MYLKEYEEELLKLKNNNNVYIYGAGDVARQVYFCLSKPPYNVKVKSFVVSEIGSSSVDDIDGIPVISYDDDSIDKTGVFVVAVLEKYKEEICALLKENNMPNLILMTFESDLWSLTRSKCFEDYCSKKEYPYIFGIKGCIENKTNQVNCNADCCVYVTRSLKDRPLVSAFELREWEKEIYAGASLSNDSVEGVRDDNGENISEKNRKYCELTAMYWIWKHTDCEYIGLSHYRRRFDFSNNEISMICNGNVDVVLTMPMITIPNVGYMYVKNHCVEDWNTMKEVVKKLRNEYADSLEIVENSNYYIPYNMFIMKREVFNDYCEWLFPILEECEKILGDKEDVYQNRYIGFLAERLMTVYFLKNKSLLKIMFCNKHFLE